MRWLWVVLLTGCTSINLELGAGYDKHISEGSNPRSVIRINAELKNCFDSVGTCVTEFNHHSSFKDGWPFNDRPEQLTNQWSVIYRYPLWESR